MNIHTASIAIILFTSQAIAADPADWNTMTPAQRAETDPTYTLDYTLNRIDGTPQQLSNFQGNVLLIVNVASECGLTPQYEGLQTLYDQKHEQGFEILAFPANQFGSQEPGTNDEIQHFCQTKFNVTFPMFEKIVVKGDDTHPLYTHLAAQPEPIGGEPEWNFTKFLIDRSGRVIARFGPRTEPLDESLLTKLDELLAEPNSD